MKIRTAAGAAVLSVLLAVGVAVSGAVAKGPESVAGLAGQLSPAVVNIGSTRHIPGNEGVPFPQVPEGSPLAEPFDERNPNNGQGEEAMREARSLGSGFIISKDGTVVTNNHVIEGADEVQVFLTDGTRLSAKVVGTDDKADLAVLKVDAGRDLPFVEFGDSDTANVGDWVMAIGNPFGLGGSVTLGIVSARNRDLQSGPYDSFIQTDAAINQGNSGGPLFDMNGKVVGINTAIIAQAGSSLGIGFAVPANVAKPILDQLAEFGETRRGWLGVGIQDVTDDIASTLNRPNTNGALAIDITPDGPSDGIIEEGDLIIEFDGKPIIRMRDLPRIVAETPVGKAVKVKVIRKGKEQVFDITLGRLEVGEKMIADAERQVVAPPADDPEQPVGPPPGMLDLVGFDIAPVDETTRKQFALSEDVKGIVITVVTPGTDAEEKGLVAGTLIEEVNQKPVTTVVDVTSMVGTAKEEGRPAVLFKVLEPTGTSRFVAIKLEQD